VSTPTKSIIHVGDFVIINETDAPQTKLVARVTKIDPGNDYITAKYICATTHLTKCAGRLSEATLLADFGVELQFEGNMVTGIQTRPSQAFYLDDGAPRDWQPGSAAPTQPLRKKREVKA